MGGLDDETRGSGPSGRRTHATREMSLRWPPSVLAEVERAEGLLAQRVLQELDVAGRAEVEPEALAKGSGEVFRGDALVALKDLRNRLHVVIVEVVLRDLVGVEAGISFDFDHIAGVAARGQILTAEITREVDHQRLIPQ